MKSATVYILRCVDGSYYTGCTTDLDRRLKEHQRGSTIGYASDHRPVELVYSEIIGNVKAAIRRERQFKGWSREKKEALIRGNFIALHKLAECRNETHFKNRQK